jgi:hypothetical protein
MTDHRVVGKSLLGALVDPSFNYMITRTVFRYVYRLTLIGSSLFALLMAWYGLAFLQWSVTLGVLILLATPMIWFFQVMTVRLTLEFLINQFKITEYLQILKDQGERRPGQ